MNSSDRVTKTTILPLQFESNKKKLGIEISKAYLLSDLHQ